jgi:hypothetical protein
MGMFIGLFVAGGVFADKLTFTNPSNGTLSAEDESGDPVVTDVTELSSGAVVTFTVTPATNYAVTNWTVDGTPKNPAVTTNTYAHTVAGNATIAVVLESSGPTTTVPGAPALVSATGGDQSVTLRWSEPSSNGGAAISGYDVAYNTTNSTTFSNWTAVSGEAAAAKSVVLTSLTNGTTYTFAVRAKNSQGNGAASDTLKAVPQAAKFPGGIALNGEVARNQSAVGGTQFTLSVAGATGVGSLSYEWRIFGSGAFSGGTVVGTNLSTFSRALATTKDTTLFYQVAISDPGIGAGVASDRKVVQFTVSVAPAGESVNGLVTVNGKTPSGDMFDMVSGSSKALSVSAFGVGTLKYEWSYVDCGEDAACVVDADDYVEFGTNLPSANVTSAVAVFKDSEVGLYKYLRYRVAVVDPGIGDDAEEGVDTVVFNVRVVREDEPYTLLVNVVGGVGGKVRVRDVSNTPFPSQVTWSYYYRAGVAVTLTAEPADGFVVKGWAVGSQAFTSGGGLKSETAVYTMGAFDDEVGVEFEPDPGKLQYRVNYTSSPANGFVLANVGTTALPAGQPVYAGTEVTLTARPNAGYRVTGWTVTTVSTPNTMPTSDTVTTFVADTSVFRVKVTEHNTQPLQGNTTLSGQITVNAVFAVKPSLSKVTFWSDSADGAANGRVTASVGSGSAAREIQSGDSTVESGQSVKFTAEGYGLLRVSEWKVGTAVQTGTNRYDDTLRATVNTHTAVRVAFARPVVTISNVALNTGANLTVGSINATLRVTSSLTLGGKKSFQWYSAVSAASATGTPIQGATDSTYQIPANLAAGATYYYFVDVGQNETGAFSGPAQTARSATVAVSIAPTYQNIANAVQTWLQWNIIRGENTKGETGVEYDLELPTDSASIVALSALRGSFPSISGISSTLMRNALSGVRINWTSSKPSVLTAAGVVTRPMFGTSDSTVTLTATIAKETATATWSRGLTVKMYEDEDFYKLGQVWNSLTWNVIDTNTRASGGRQISGLRDTNVVRNLVLPTVASTANKLAEYAGVSISWSPAANSVFAYKTVDATKATGEITRLKSGGDVTFNLVATIKKENASGSEISLTKTFTAKVPAKEIVGAEFIVFENESKVYNGARQLPTTARIPSTQVAKFGPMTDTSFNFIDSVALNVGVYRVSAVFEGLDAYSLPNTRTLTITPKPLTSASVRLTVDAMPAASLIYDGEPKGVAAYTVVDGSADLVRNMDYAASYRAWDGTSRSDGVIIAGTGNNLVITGRGNYNGTLTYAFAVTKRALSLDLENCAVAPKVYDGTTAVVKSGLTIAVSNLVESDAVVFNAAKPFNVTGLAYNGANVTAAGIVSGAVRLDTAGLTTQQKSVANNYTLSTAPAFRKTDAAITVKTPDRADISIGRTLPDSALKTGTAATFGTPQFAGGKSNGTGGTLTLQFRYSDGLSAKVPVEIGTYEVVVTVKGGTNPNFVDGDVAMGEWKINKPLSAEVTALSADTTIRAKGTANLSVTATSPNEGTLTYRWFRNDTLIAGASSNSYRFATTATTALGEYNFHVLVINAKASGALAQSPDTLKSNNIKVTVDEAARSLAAARVTVLDQFEYDGYAKIPVEVQVQLGQDQLTSDDFDIEYLNNVNAGMAVVNVTGKNKYEGKATGSFRIAQKSLVYGEDFDVRSVTIYNGKPQPLAIIPLGEVSGIGPVTVTYDGGSTVPTDAGTYEVVVRFAAGQNYKASDTMSLGDYDILQKLFTEEDLAYTKWPTQILQEDAKGIGAVKIKDTTFADYGTLTVKYNESEEVPTELGSYKVTVTITGGDNYYYAIIPLADYNVVDVIGVKSADRVVPKPVVTEEAAVAPVAKVAASFSVGPNVARAGETVKFFSSKPVKSGTLFVFDANGNVVAKVSAKSGVGAIGSLLVKSEGTYAVKGALAGKDGTRVKVSTLFTVVR